MKFQKIFVQIITIGLVAMWAYAGITKLLEYRTFVDQLSSYPLIGKYSAFVAWALPVLMIGMGLLLTLNISKSKALLASTSLLVLMTGYLFYVIRFSPIVPCTCNGIWPFQAWNMHIIINGAIILVSMAGVFLNAHSFRAITLNTQRPHAY